MKAYRAKRPTVLKAAAPQADAQKKRKKPYRTGCMHNRGGTAKTRRDTTS